MFQGCIIKVSGCIIIAGEANVSAASELLLLEEGGSRLNLDGARL